MITDSSPMHKVISVALLAIISTSVFAGYTAVKHNKEKQNAR
jgi:hypothetical protein